MKVICALLLSVVYGVRLRGNSILNLPTNLDASYSEADLSRFYLPKKDLFIPELSLPIFTDPLALPAADVDQVNLISYGYK